MSKNVNGELLADPGYSDYYPDATYILILMLTYVSELCPCAVIHFDVITVVCEKITPLVIASTYRDKPMINLYLTFYLEHKKFISNTSRRSTTAKISIRNARIIFPILMVCPSKLFVGWFSK